MGFFDMHGNVLEYTADWYQETYLIGPVIDPSGPETGSLPKFTLADFGELTVQIFVPQQEWGVTSDNRDDGSGFRLRQHVHR